MSPEIFFTHYQFHRPYKQGKLAKEKRRSLSNRNEVSETTLSIDTSLSHEFYNAKVSDFLDDNTVGQLLGWKYKYLNEAKKVSCYFIETETGGFIIPHYAIAIYYYYRSTVLREAVFNNNIEALCLGYECNRDHASIVIPNYVSEVDAPFIHRFVCQEDAKNSFNNTANALYNYMKVAREKYQTQNVSSVPIKAKFPVLDNINIRVRHNFLQVGKKFYFYVHEILNDNSDIGFDNFTVLISCVM